MSEIGNQGTTSAKSPSKKYEGFATALYNFVSLVEGYDQQMLPMCMRAFEITLGVSQSQLSTMATMSTMSQLGCCLIWGILVDNNDPQYLLAAGLLVVGMASILLSTASHYKVILFLRFLHGFAFACIYPSQQRIVSDSQDESKFSMVFGYYGWRTSYVMLGYMWILVGIAIALWMKWSPNTNSDTAANGQQPIATSANKGSFTAEIKQSFSDVFTQPTPGILILAVFISEAPLCAFSYVVLYLQYLGVSDVMAGAAVAVTLIGAAVACAAGGMVMKTEGLKTNDYLHLSCGVVVMVIRLVVCLCFFLGPAPPGRLLWYHYIEFALIGASLMTVGAVDRPLINNSIQKKIQGTASAIIRCISGIASSVIFYQLAAYLSEKVFGYVPSREAFDVMEASIKDRNKEALRKSMMYIIVAGSVLNTLCYIALFPIYPGHKQNLNKENGVAAAAKAAA
ncbi:MAJOR FACILITATOR SUPERFAMILY MEMBER protein,putative [Babesia bigemina]|uniref:MAJOR FACILITATOR SUPERFAMILY MEMBER protein,putative n=1 Tax=Babesia bigemina TaxID=5866 RepID=A0A061D844_BABBI|nr:MAJOR FACILITATOR SUPERFAMILY MEMBER protein,putative [Babesia bigemina]CDR95094.1 MAJOR FACILITATOR SUPERFAMILY MEMBER protein,putative [Babesia bigemina]|eukprot:XP_012767280.1 MAJOR FACILITATOR SUPERFAMILY MEMBER protein,putative [Babesia bigemina]